MLITKTKKTRALNALTDGNIAVEGIIPQSNWGGIETSEVLYNAGNAYIAYRENYGTPGSWKRAKLHATGKGFYFLAFGQRRYLEDVIALPKLTGIPKRW